MATRGAVERLSLPIEAALRKFAGDSKLPLYEMLRYHLGWVDEMKRPARGGSQNRVHGAFTLLAAEASRSSASSTDSAQSAAVAAELAAASWVVQEDLRLGNPSRGDRPALWWVFGHAQGINAADGLYSLARLALMGQAGMPPEQVVRELSLLDAACLQVAQETYREIAAGSATLKVSEYVSLVEAEYGALMGAAMGLGALAAGREDLVAAMLKAGKVFGAANRLRGEIDLLADRGAEVIEVLDKKRSLPLLYAIEHASEDEVIRLQGALDRDQPIRDELSAQVLLIMESSGGVRYAEALVRRYLDTGLRTLQEAGVDAEKLAQAAREMTIRAVS